MDELREAIERAMWTRPLIPTCHSKPRRQWCDHSGPGGFMGHTCGPDLWYPLPWIAMGDSE